MAFVLASLRTVGWAASRPPELTRRSWEHCLALGVYAPDGGQAGFCRVMTDYTFRAHLADVFVRSASRGAGLGRALVAAALAHPELVTVTRWTLTTADAHRLYRTFGFRLGEADGRWMTLDRSLPA